MSCIAAMNVVVTRATLGGSKAKAAPKNKVTTGEFSPLLQSQARLLRLLRLHLLSLLLHVPPRPCFSPPY